MDRLGHLHAGISNPGKFRGTPSGRIAPAFAIAGAIPTDTGHKEYQLR